ncbi:aldo/keto reductase [Brachyspira murdochii]|uniref:aldo/keto reductase n=1 Tax=Brachyspira murdochii TaxID=84378 RepID=UPI0012F488FE|nr:aldo/keto reductase [Brachyspira murdochii]
MNNIKLNNGIEMPILGFGVYKIDNYEECKKSCLYAIEAGYRHIDTASIYMNEKAVGDAIKESGINRKEMFITTKLWIQDADYDKAKKAFQISMEKLGLDYLDLYLIHMPFGNYYSAWKAMEELYEAGHIKAIGVCNFYKDRLVDFVHNHKIMPAINQIETHPFFQRWEDQELMKEYNITLESWAPLAEGSNNIFNNEILKSIGKKYNKTIAQVILRWLTQRNIPIIPKSVNKERIIENSKIFDFILDDNDMNLIKTLDNNKNIIFLNEDEKFIKKLLNMKY